MPDDTDYSAIVNSQGICTDVNSGVIDEVWMFGGPYFGFYESRLAGPNAFWYNSPPLEGTNCNKLVPIMGFNYEHLLGLGLPRAWLLSLLLAASPQGRRHGV